MRRRIGGIVVGWLLVLARPAMSGQEAGTMKIRLTFDGQAVEATLPVNATARDLLSLLPMTLTLEDYASTEKIGYPPRKLSTAGAPAGVDPSVGDIAYSAPWGNLAIFYKEFGYSRGLIGPGRIDSGIETLNEPLSEEPAMRRWSRPTGTGELTITSVDPTRRELSWRSCRWLCSLRRALMQARDEPSPARALPRSRRARKRSGRDRRGFRPCFR
jgi:hypothetical protein